MTLPTQVRRTLLAAALVLLPAFANANLIVTTGQLASGATDFRPFDVTDAGYFISNVTSSFQNIHGILDLNVTLLQLSNTGYSTFTFGNLGVGSYLLGIRNLSGYDGGYIATIGSTNGEAHYVPEPASLTLLGAGLLGLAALRRRRHR